MRKRIFGRRLKRDTNERKALFRSLMNGMVLHGKIRTTTAKAKSIQGGLEKLLTIAKNDGESGKRLLMSRMVNEKVVEKLISEIAPLFKDRAGGYTKIISMGPRVKDGAKMVYMTWTETVIASPIKEAKRNKGEKVKGKMESSATSKVKGEKEVKTKTKKSSK